MENERAEGNAQSGDDFKDELDAMTTRLHAETALWQRFLAAHQLVVGELSHQMLRDHRLPLESFDVLIHLADVPGTTLRQKELRDRLLLSESGVSRLLARMARDGLITRVQADDDRRGVEIALTREGRDALTSAVESHVQLVASLFTDRLSAGDRSTLDRIFSKLTTSAMQ